MKKDFSTNNLSIFLHADFHDISILPKEKRNNRLPL